MGSGNSSLWATDASFRGRPSTDVLDTMQCRHCRKPILRHIAPAHIKRCLDKKAAKSWRKKDAKGSQGNDRR